jgi:hypothetical protein
LKKKGLLSKSQPRKSRRKLMLRIKRKLIKMLLMISNAKNKLLLSLRFRRRMPPKQSLKKNKL